MRKLPALILALLTSLSPSLGLAQGPAPAQDATPVIRATTRVVLVDVVATNNSGAPVTDLKPEDFTLEESGHKQKIAFFSLEQRDQNQAPQELAPYNYSNRPQFTAPSGPLTVILIDALNTPLQDQQRARQQLLRYVANQLKAGQRIAVYALANHLTKLQDFTSDPLDLRLAIENFFPHNAPGTLQAPTDPGHASTAVATLTGINGSVETGAQRATAAAVRGIQDFAAQETNFNLQVRMGTTVQALRSLSNNLAGYPGRKNLVWVAAVYPFLLAPEDTSAVELEHGSDPTAPPPLPNETGGAVQATDVSNSFNQEIRKTETMLSEAQIAVYPVDPRGLFNISGTADASTSGLDAAGLLQMGHEYGYNVSHSGSVVASQQSVMNDVAQQTGGKAFMNRNDIDNSIALASADGTTYYTLGYYPDKKKFDGSYRKFKVETSRPGVRLRYRAGYFAFDNTKSTPKERDAETMGALSSSSVNANKVYFDALVPPPDKPGNPAKIPVKFLVPASSFSAEDNGKGGQKVNLDFFIAVFNKDGKAVKIPRMTVDTTLPPEQWAQIQKVGMLVPMDIDLPAPGDYNLRLAVRDNRTGYVGALSAQLSLPKAP